MLHEQLFFKLYSKLKEFWFIVATVSFSMLASHDFLIQNRLELMVIMPEVLGLNKEKLFVIATLVSISNQTIPKRL